MHILKQMLSAWPATTTKQPQGHFSFSLDSDSNSNSPASKFVAFILLEVRALQPALCMPLGAMALRICQHLGRTKSCRSYLGHQSSQHTFRLTYIPVQEAGGDLPLKTLIFDSEFQAEKELLAPIPSSAYPDPAST